MGVTFMGVHIWGLRLHSGLYIYGGTYMGVHIWVAVTLRVRVITMVCSSGASSWQRPILDPICMYLSQDYLRW